ncbi:ankyrin-3-like [Phymastichus coffea]|uniref:ankyrin-3-like n=1 Tax=Phymastichus coffea TaxID=108790 RepID=UPI00273BBDB5|nr:ankyrin-3-like [Phymastichus coffea]
MSDLKHDDSNNVDHKSNDSKDDNILLHLAVMEENYDVVKFLLKHNVPVNGRAVNRELGLEFLTDNEHQRHIEATLIGVTGQQHDNKGKENVKPCLQKSATALHLAARCRSKEIAECLLLHGADVNAEMEGGETPLMIAVFSNCSSVVELLIESGANVNARTAWGKAALHYAAQGGNKQITEMLVLTGAQVNAANLQGITPLHIAAESAHEDVLSLLLKSGADTSIRTQDGATALHYAAVMGHKKVVEILLSYGADMNVLLKQGTLDLTPFKWVTPAEEKKVWDLISNYTNKLSIRNIFQSWIFRKSNRSFSNNTEPREMETSASMLLHAAVLENNEKAVRFLLKHGARANAPCRHGVKYLRQNFSDHRTEISEISSRYRSLSLSSGCIITPNPVVWAPGSAYTFSGRGRSHSVDEHRPKSLTPMHVAAANGHPGITKMLIGHGGDANARMEGDYTPLVIALLYKHHEVVEMLTNVGANLNRRMRNGKTPMYFAVKSKRPSLVALLLKKGADPNAATDHGVTPLHIAVERKLAEVAELLLACGAHANARTKTGVTPLHCAAATGQTNIVELILRHGGDVSAILKRGEIDVAPLLWVTESERRKIAELVRNYAPASKAASPYGTLVKRLWKQLALKKY